MKITTKHRIAYKLKEAPGEPVEEALFKSKIGGIQTATGTFVTHADGTLYAWVQNLIEGNSEHYEGHLVPPPFEPHVGMVVENPKNPSQYAVCYLISNERNTLWITNEIGHLHGAEVRKLIKDEGWQVREVKPHED